MPIKIGRTTTPRNKIPFDKVPSSMSTRSASNIERYARIDYAAMLDTTIEHADALMSANGISAQQAVAQALRDLEESEQNWHILPSHQKLIASMLLPSENNLFLI